MQNVSKIQSTKRRTPRKADAANEPRQATGGRKSDRKAANQAKEQDWERFNRGEYRYEPFESISDHQNQAFNSAISNDLTIAIGPAGTGKSFVGAHAAAKLFIEGRVEQIILTRSPLPTGMTAGFRPGDTYDKLIPYLTPLIDTFRKVLKTETGSDGFFNYLWEKKIINIRDLETIKGASLDDAFIIVEEAQECDMEQLKNLLTRASDSSYLFLNGDLGQSNARLRTNALQKYVESFRDYNARLADNTLTHLHMGEPRPEWMKPVSIVEFDKSDRNGRGGLTRLMLEINDLYQI